jgi:hypothetical protein
MRELGNAKQRPIERRQGLVVAAIRLFALPRQSIQIFYADCALGQPRIAHLRPTNPSSGLLGDAYLRLAMRPA